jgi:hypothetical protein
MALKRNGSRPGEHRGGRKKGTPNKVSIPQIMINAQTAYPTMDAAGLQRYAAAGILAEIEKVRATKNKYNARVMVDWYVKLARVAWGYGRDADDRPDFVEVRAELSRLNPEQLLVLKQLALIAAGGATGGASAGSAAAGVRRTISGTAGSGRAGKDPSKLR